VTTVVTRKCTPTERTPGGNNSPKSCVRQPRAHQKPSATISVTLDPESTKPLILSGTGVAAAQGTVALFSVSQPEEAGVCSTHMLSTPACAQQAMVAAAVLKHADTACVYPSIVCATPLSGCTYCPPIQHSTGKHHATVPSKRLSTWVEPKQPRNHSWQSLSPLDTDPYEPGSDP
jgi:hypothetical protein